jgi:hypothetical protein
MSNTKEKAKELVNKYWGKGITNDKEIAKQCALIAVDEILHYSKAHGFIELTKFHKEVKQEIEKL